MDLAAIKAWLNDRQAAHLAAIPDRLPQYQAMSLDGQPGETLENEAAISQAMRIILLTRPYQVPQRPSFGSRLFEQVDKPFATARSAIVRETLGVLATWEPRVEVMEIDLDLDPDTGRFVERIQWQTAEGAEGDSQISI